MPEIDNVLLLFCLVMGFMLMLVFTIPALLAIGYKEEIICWLKMKGYIKPETKQKKAEEEDTTQ